MALGKTARKIVVVAALAVAALLVVAYFARNAVAASILRSTGSRLLGTKLDVDSVDIDLFGLAVGLHGLRVDNPEGWGTPRALEARSIRVALSGDSRLDRLVVLPDRVLVHPRQADHGMFSGRRFDDPIPPRLA